MNWAEARQAHPDRWLVFEAIAAYSEHAERVVDQVAIVAAVDDPEEAMRQYLDLHRREPARELYVAHTSRESLMIEERKRAPVPGTPCSLR